MSDQVLQSNEKVAKLPHDYAVGGATTSGITRERSFVRSNTQHQNNKRRSLAINQQHHHLTHQQLQQQQMRSKPAIELYRPPSKFQAKTKQHFYSNFAQKREKQ